MLHARPIAVWLTAGALLLACRRDNPEVEAAAQRFEQRRAAFVGFDRWAQRALLGADAFRSERALAEALFSRVRSDRELLGAWVQTPAEPRRLLAFPEGAELPALATAVRLRDRELGVIEVLLAVPCPAPARAPQPSAPRTCSVLSRAHATARGEVRVAAAFDASSGARPP